MEMEKADLGIELSFQRDRLKLKEAEAQQLELDALELGARLSKSATDYVSWILGLFTDTAFPLTGGPKRGTATATGSQAAQVCHSLCELSCKYSHSRAACIKQHMRRQTFLGTPMLPLGPCPNCCHLCAGDHFRGRAPSWVAYLAVHLLVGLWSSSYGPGSSSQAATAGRAQG